MSLITSQSYVFDPRPDYPFLVTAKRYSSPNSAPDGFTLVFAHGTGFHKETWEPTMGHLFHLAKHGKFMIRECWTIDAPNHGEAAVLNDKVLSAGGYDLVFEWEEFARAIHLFLAGLGKGVDVDFTKHKLVPIGHSMGAVAFVQSTTYHPLISYHSMYLVEPMILPPATFQRPSFLEEGAMKRRDIWANREEAFEIFKKRTFKVWDERCIKLFVEYGLRPLPTHDYPDKTNGVTLTCTKLQEAATFRDFKASFVAFNFLGTIVQRLPVHCVYGGIDDYIPSDVKDRVINVAAGGKDKFASFVRVPGAGHLVVQTKPEALAETIWRGLEKDVAVEQAEKARL